MQMKVAVLSLLSLVVFLAFLQLGLYYGFNKDKASRKPDTQFERNLELSHNNQLLTNKVGELEKKLAELEKQLTNPTPLPHVDLPLPNNSNDGPPPKKDDIPPPKENTPPKEDPPPKKDIPLSEWKTNVRCFFFSDFTQMCLYDHLCTDGKQLVFLDPEQESEKIRMSGPELSSRFDQKYYEPYPFPVIDAKYVPAGSTFLGQAYSIPSSRLGKEKSVELLPGTIWYSPFDGSANNLWHICAQNMLMWEAQLYNETLPEGAKLPSIDYVQSGRDYIGPGWQAEMLEAMVQPHTQFLFPQFFLTENDFQQKRAAWYNVRDETKFFHNLTILLRPPGKASIGENNLVCSEKAVVFSQKPRLFSGTYSAHRFKAKIAEHLGFPPQKPRGKFNNINTIANKVVLDFRGERTSRNLHNRNEILELLAYYNLNVVDTHSWAPMTNLSTQIEELWDADLYIIVHGAGVTNAMFLPYRASLIEIYPWGYRPSMYDNMADAIGLHYTGLQSYIKGQLVNNPCGGELYSTKYHTECQHLSNTDHLANACGGYAKNSCVHVPIRELETALLDSYDYIGENLNVRVDKLFSHTREFRENDYHHINNTFWTSDPWEHGITDPITWEEHLKQTEQQP